MSLIMDALKKAQQLRLKEFRGGSPHRPSEPKTKGSLTSLGRIGGIVGAGLVCLFVLLFVFGRLVPPPVTTKPNQAVAVIKKKPSIPITKNLSQEPSIDILSQPMGSPSLSKEIPNQPQDVLSQPKEILSQSKDHLSSPQVEKTLAKREPLIEKKTEEPPARQMAQEKKVIGMKPDKKAAIEKSLLLPPPPSPKEQVATASMDVKKEEDKHRTLMSDILTHFNWGVHFHNQGETLKAIQAYQKVIQLDPTYIEAYNNLGIIYQEINDFDRALGVFQRSIEINPQYEKGHNNLGILLYHNGRYEQAIEAFQKALAINPNNIESHINLGILYKQQGQPDKAIASYQKALDINPLRGETHYNIGLLYEQLEKVELAIDHYQKFIQLSSGSHPGLALKVHERLDYLSRVRANQRR
jgi:tetratricopeptide (TPR) repeat protein